MHSDLNHVQNRPYITPMEHQHCIFIRYLLYTYSSARNATSQPQIPTQGACPLSTYIHTEVTILHLCQQGVVRGAAPSASPGSLLETKNHATPQTY